MRLVVAITGASGVHLGFKFLSLIPLDIEVFAIISKSAKKTLYQSYKSKKGLSTQNI